ncbi:hypothetical protein HXX76_007425 [Chlamydomonas incerta]|uniref:PARP-type domain-containing protein n=1 Tax=Chlamydomonas incerta TaxID=51695 RepID=A0A835SXX6_CHLIN|nr:hypothetical protein HXX76_007425 [Chlamydomonas incerta]|eukprot:KAG2435352.1 hypothetical protein HXX76_007425 [Chlamydomonas incerta]
MGDRSANYIIERAKGSGDCQGCGVRIKKGELRLNCQFWNPSTECMWDKRRHISCVTGRVALNSISRHGSVSALPGFDQLTADERQEVEELWLSAISDEATDGLTREKMGRSRRPATGCQKEALAYIRQHAPGMLASLDAEAERIAEEEERLEAQADPEKLARNNRKRAKQEAAVAAAKLEAGEGEGLGAAGAGNALAAPAAAAAAAALMMSQPLPQLLQGLPPGLLQEAGSGASGAGQGGLQGLPQTVFNAYMAQLQLLMARQAVAGVGASGAAGDPGSAAAASGGPAAPAAAGLAAGGSAPEPMVKEELGVKPEPAGSQQGLGAFTTAAAPLMAQPAPDLSQLLASPQLLAPGTPARQLSAMLATGTTGWGGAAGRSDGAVGADGEHGGAAKLRVSTRRRKAPVKDDLFAYGAEAEVEEEMEKEVEATGGWACGGAATKAKARGGRGRGRGRGGRRGRAGLEEEDPDFVIA